MTTRVLVVVKGLDVGGVERMVVDLAIGLQRAGDEVAVAVINPRRAALRAHLVDEGVAVHDLGGTDRLGRTAVARLRHLIDGLAPDVVHAHGPLAGVAASLAGRRTGLVVTIHSMWGRLRRPSRVALRVTLPPTAAVIAVSDLVRVSLPKRLAGRAVVIGHGIDPESCRRVVRPHDDRRGCDVVSVASHRRVKNHRALLRGVAHAITDGHDIHLRVIGDGPLRGSNERFAESLGIADHVTFESARPDVLDCIAAADVFVLSSDAEGQPLVLLEAMAVGTPVIATAVGRAPTLLEHGAGELVAPGDWRGIADRLERLCTEPLRRDELRRAALVAVAPHTVARAVEEHRHLYTTLSDR